MNETTKLTDPYKKYQVDGDDLNNIEAAFWDLAATTGESPTFLPSAGMVHNSLSVPVNTHLTRVTAILTYINVMKVNRQCSVVFSARSTTSRTGLAL